MGIRSRAKIRQDGLKLNSLVGRSPGGGEVHDYRTPKVTKPLGRTRKKGFPDK